MFEKIARFSVRYRWFIIVFWILMVPVVSANFPSITKVEKNQTSDFLPKNSPTAQAARLETAFQQRKTATNAVLVVSRSGGLTTADQTAVTGLIQKLKHVSDVTEVRSVGVSADGQAQELFVGLTGAAFGQQSTVIVQNLRDTVKAAHLPA